MKIHIARNGRVLGAYDLEAVSKYLDNGNLKITDLSWTKGYKEWVNLGDMLRNLKETEELSKFGEQNFLDTESSSENSSTNENIVSRVAKIEKDILRIKKLYDETLSFHRSHPAIALSQARKSAEAICKKIYINENLDQSGKPVDKLMLNDLISSLYRSKIIPKHISIALGTIQHYGNFGTHDQGEDGDENITEKFTQPALYALNEVVDWFLNIYFKSGIPIPNIEQNDDKELINDKEEIKSDEEILNNWLNGAYNDPDKTTEVNIKNLENIYSQGHIEPVFKRNQKYAAKYQEGVAMICYTDLYNYDFIIRKGIALQVALTNEYSFIVNGDDEVIASYESIEQLIKDGWRLD